MIKEETKPDFSKITSVEQAIEAKLSKILLFPEEFGGLDEPNNVVYVPYEIAQIKDQITGDRTWLQQKDKHLLMNIMLTDQIQALQNITLTGIKIHLL